MRFLNNLDNRTKFIIALSAGAIAFALLMVMLSIVLGRDQGHDNYKLTSEQKAVQDTIQKKAGRDDIKYSKTLKEIDGWSLVQVNAVGSRDTYAIAIMHDGNGVLGPAEYFEVDDMADKGVPDEIMSVVYPNTVLWVHFDKNLLPHFQYDTDDIKSTISAFAANRGISLHRVDITNQPTYAGSYHDNSNTATFNFTLNNSGETYTLTQSATPDASQQIYTIKNTSGVVLFTLNYNV